MKTARARTGDFTYDDFCALVNEQQKADLIDGVIYMASPENVDANDLFCWLLVVMRLYVRKRKLGKVYGSRVACRLDDKNAPEPDIFFVSNQRLHQVNRGGVEGSPDLALEIVSPSSVERDYEKKRKQYQHFGISEYWIIDEWEQKVLLLRLDSRGKYREVRPRKGVLFSEVLTGFWLRPAWLWQDPLPDEMDILQQLLSD